MIDQLLEDYNQLRDAEDVKDMPRLEKAVLLVTRATFAAEADVEAEVSKLSTWTGWLRRQSGVGRTSPENGGVPQSAGLLLSAEWCAPNAESKHLRQDGKGGWLLYHYREFATEADARVALRESGGEGQLHICLRERAAVLGEGTDSDLAYDIYWGGKGSNTRRLCSRFAGFAQHAQEGE